MVIIISLLFVLLAALEVLCLFFPYSFSYVLTIFSAAAVIAAVIIEIFLIVKKRRIALKIISLFLGLFSLALTILGSLLIKKEENLVREYVIHATGSFKEDYKPYPNSVETFTHWASSGVKYIEVDFLFTSDNEIVCAHYFDKSTFKTKPTLSEFEETLIYGKYHGLTFSKLIELLELYPDVKVIFDTKEADAFTILRKMINLSGDFDIFSRFIIQTYSLENYRVQSQLGFTEYWFTNYKSRYTPSQITKYFASEDKITTIVLDVPSFSLFKQLDYKTHKKLAVHTINNKEQINYFFDRGANFVFADYI